MTAQDLYLSMLEKANLKKSTHQQYMNDEFDYSIETIEFKISNKQGFFMNSLLCQRKTYPNNQQLCISSTNSEYIYLIFPPHFIKINGFFEIRKSIITRIYKN